MCVRVNVNYYTDANLAVDLKVLDVFGGGQDEAGAQEHRRGFVTALVTMFKKIKLNTHENVGYGPVTLPEMEDAHHCILGQPAGGHDRHVPTDLQNGLLGLSNVLANAAPIYLMCSPGDIRVVHQVRAPFTQRPSVYIYDNYPGESASATSCMSCTGNCSKTAAHMVESCGCESGCRHASGRSTSLLAPTIPRG